MCSPCTDLQSPQPVQQPARSNPSEPWAFRHQPLAFAFPRANKRTLAAKLQVVQLVTTVVVSDTHCAQELASSFVSPSQGYSSLERYKADKNRGHNGNTNGATKKMCTAKVVSPVLTKGSFFSFRMLPATSGIPLLYGSALLTHSIAPRGAPVGFAKPLLPSAYQAGEESPVQDVVKPTFWGTAKEAWNNGGDERWFHSIEQLQLSQETARLLCAVKDKGCCFPNTRLLQAIAFWNTWLKNDDVVPASAHQCWDVEWC